jgi:hypothetical protein
MTHYPDLSDYDYFRVFYRPGTKSVGWLGVGHNFETNEPTEELLRRLWSFCKVSVVQTIGMHDCEFCPTDTSNFVERNGEHLWLGSAEIRVFSETDRLYAAPNLIYHYVSVHRYKPPDEFVQALMAGPAPPSQQYFDRLANLNLEWCNTASPDTQPVRFKLRPKSP